MRVDIIGTYIRLKHVISELVSWNTANGRLMFLHKLESEPRWVLVVNYVF